MSPATEDPNLNVTTPPGGAETILEQPPPIGTILGAVFGLLFAIAAGVAIWWFVANRRGQTTVEEGVEYETDFESGETIFDIVGDADKFIAQETLNAHGIPVQGLDLGVVDLGLEETNFGF
jgi:CDP-diglyceride synthetase